MGLPGGVWTALLTPFNDDGSIDIEAFRKTIKRQVNAGVHALLPCGTTGESATLSETEKAELVMACGEISEGKPVIAGAGHNSTLEAIKSNRKMAEAGANATLHVTPYYNKPTQEGLYRHFREIADSHEVPVILYNNPTRTAVDLHPETVLRLVKDSNNILGLKETSTDFARTQNLIVKLKDIKPEFLMMAGDDALFLPFLAFGAHGIISSSSNLVPEVFCGVYSKFNKGDLADSRTDFEKITKLVPLLFMRTNPLPLKTAMFLAGHMKNRFRLPLCSMDAEDTEGLKANLTQLGYL